MRYKIRSYMFLAFPLLILFPIILYNYITPFFLPITQITEHTIQFYLKLQFDFIVKLWILYFNINNIRRNCFSVMKINDQNNLFFQTRYRRSIDFLVPFKLVTKLVYWDERYIIYIIHTYIYIYKNKIEPINFLP